MAPIGATDTAFPSTFALYDAYLAAHSVLGVSSFAQSLVEKNLRKVHVRGYCTDGAITKASISNEAFSSTMGLDDFYPLLRQDLRPLNGNSYFYQYTLFQYNCTSGLLR